MVNLIGLIPNNFGDPELKDEGKHVERWGKIYTLVYFLSVIGGVVGIVGNIAMNGSNEIYTEPRGYDPTNANQPALTQEEIRELFDDPNKREVTCHCSGDTSVYSDFYRYTFPILRVCNLVENFDLEKCVQQENAAEAMAAGLMCTPGTTKEDFLDTKDGLFGFLDGGGSTKFMSWTKSSCKSAEDLLRSISDNSLASIVEERNTLVLKSELLDRLKTKMLRTFLLVHPVWKTQMKNNMVTAAFNTPQGLIKMKTESCTAKEAQAGICREGGLSPEEFSWEGNPKVSGGSYYNVPTSNGMFGGDKGVSGYNKMGLFMGDYGGGLELPWYDDDDNAVIMDFNGPGNTPMKSYAAAFLEPVLAENKCGTDAEKSPLWCPFWSALAEAGKAQKSWAKAYEAMYLDVENMWNATGGPIVEGMPTGEIILKLTDDEYKVYFDKCKPNHCEFIHFKGFDPSVMLVAVLGSLAGLQSVLLTVFKVFFAVHKKLLLKKRRTVTPENKQENKSEPKNGGASGQPATKVTTAAEQARQVMVIVPPGVQSGATLQVETPVGLKNVTIPPDVVSGQTISVSY